jgi:hypothetical protein
VFCGDKIVSVQGLADTFDAAEQVVGHRIDAFGEPDRPVSGGVVAL